MDSSGGGSPKALWPCLALAGVALALGAPGPARAQTQAAWVQLVDGGAVEVRAAAGVGETCPMLTVDGRPTPMALRAAPDAAFPVLCQLKLPTGARTAEIAGRPLPLPRPHIDRIVVMGDTGCRLKGFQVQNCNDPKAWPFAAVARRAAAEHPDLVIHVGDYYYRESACPLNLPGCAGSPHGDVWPTWAAEFFDPARPLLDAAPWVFARGNHESCSRGGRGWFRLLDAADAPLACPTLSAPFAVPIGGPAGASVTLHVLDSADTDDRATPPAAVAAFKAALETVKPTPGETEWIVTHRPIWGLVPVARIGPFGPINVALNATEQAAVRGEPLTTVRLILSGHIHHFASVSFGPQRPAQLIVGTGGDVGESADTRDPTGDIVEIDGLEAKTLEFERFGYFVLDRAGEDWRGAFKDVDGRIVAACTLHARILSCRRAR